MYSADFPASLIIEAAAELQVQKDICEVMPQVRLSHYDKGNPRFGFVCQHEDSGINCGASARGCTRCLRKEEVYEANRGFGEMIGGLLHNLNP